MGFPSAHGIAALCLISLGSVKNTIKWGEDHIKSSTLCCMNVSHLS